MSWSGFLLLPPIGGIGNAGMPFGIIPPAPPCGIPAGMVGMGMALGGVALGPTPAGRLVGNPSGIWGNPLGGTIGVDSLTEGGGDTDCEGGAG